MQEVLLVHELEASDHLLRQHAHSLETKFAIAVLEKILERRAQQLHDHALVVALNTIPVNLRDPSAASKEPVELVFILQLGELSLYWLKLNCHRLLGGHVAPLINLSEGAGADFLNELIVLPNS